MSKSRKGSKKRAVSQVPFLPRRLPRPRVAIDGDVAWFAIWTAPRAEDRIRRRLEQDGFPVYLPVEGVARLKLGKLVEHDRPAISRYAFVGLDPGSPTFWAVEAALEQWGGLQTLGRLLRANSGQPLRVPAIALQRLADGLTVFEEPKYRFRPGDSVRVKDGPFSGWLVAVEHADDVRVRGLAGLFGGTVRADFEHEQLELAA